VRGWMRRIDVMRPQGGTPIKKRAMLTQARFSR
jgi:hypothetical protein